MEWLEQEDAQDGGDNHDRHLELKPKGMRGDLWKKPHEPVVKATEEDDE